jgi:acetylornithine/succinyldiaminopimelate/putrescine aminotransferase
MAAAVDAGTAGVVIEPIQGESGVHPVPRELLAEIRAACDEHGALLIFDEVQTGMGRTGTLWAYEQTGVVPDVMTVAKALGGGLPIGALIASPAYAEVLAPGDHGSTFGGGPIASAASHAVLDLLEEPGFLARVGEMGELLIEGLRELPGVLEVRGRGLMVAVEVGGDAPGLVRRALLEERLVLNATGPTTIRFLPPLTVSEAEVREALARLGRVLEG